MRDRSDTSENPEDLPLEQAPVDRLLQNPGDADSGGTAEVESVFVPGAISGEVGVRSPTRRRVTTPRAEAFDPTSRGDENGEVM
jgi:hypothetical protein